MNNVYIFGEITNDSAKEAIKELLDHDSRGEQVSIYLNSLGGFVDQGLAIYDVIKMLNIPPIIYCVGSVTSVSVIILLAVPKTNRIGLVHSRYAMHYTSAHDIAGMANVVKKEVNRIKMFDTMFEDIISDATGQQINVVKRDLENELEVNADDALSYGLIGGILND